MKKVWMQVLLLSSMVLFVVACQPPVKQKTSQTQKPIIVPNTSSSYKACKSPRPEMCTHQFQPVCAKRDTGVRCFTTPCPSTEKATYGNACSACADKKVIGYIEGVCSSE